MPRDAAFRIAGREVEPCQERRFNAALTLCRLCEAANGVSIGDDIAKQRFQTRFVAEIEHIGKSIRQFGIAMRRCG